MDASLLLRVSLICMSVVVAAFLTIGVRRVQPPASTMVAISVIVWMASTGLLASFGALSFTSRPPTMFVLLLAAVGLTVWLAFSPLGKSLATGIPLTWLVGYQVFRVPVELWLARGHAEGVFPEQMTYSGLNFDIVSGVTAALVAMLVHKGVAGQRLVFAWNCLGIVLLANIVTIAILSAPVPFRLFTNEPANVYVTGFPGVWLPAVLVQGALFGHLLVFRRLSTRKPAD